MPLHVLWNCCIYRIHFPLWEAKSYTRSMTSFPCRLFISGYLQLAHKCLNQMANILHTTYLNAFLWQNLKYLDSTFTEICSCRVTMTINLHWFGKQIITSANNDAVQWSIYASSCPNMLTHKMPMNTFHKIYFLQKIISYCCRHSACIPDLVFPWTVMFMIYNTRHAYSCW